MSAKLVIGTQWGDEGKAKLIDYLASQVDVVVRYQGGSNAGHTVHVGDKKYIFHLIPSGILYPHIECILGGGMVISPDDLFEEFKALEKSNISYENSILIADNAHILLPYHKEMDIYKETKLAKGQPIGTTKKGIAFCYNDKILREGIRMGNLYEESFYADRLPHLIEQKNVILEGLYQQKPLDLAKETDTLHTLAEKLKPYVINVPYYLDTALTNNKKVLLEGAQGTMLDLDLGTYPYVTSSNPTTGGAIVGSGISYQYLKEVIGVTKAYTTRVGNGPFPTELSGKEATMLQEYGNEFGSTTGRPRRCGWFDAEVVRHSARINGLNAIALTKLDVLDSFSSIKVAIGYKDKNDRLLSYLPNLDYGLVEPIYKEFDGWETLTSNCKTFDELPTNAKKYIEVLEEYCGIPINLVSVGSSRDQTIIKRNFCNW